MLTGERPRVSVPVSSSAGDTISFMGMVPCMEAKLCRQFFPQKFFEEPARPMAISSRMLQVIFAFIR